METLTMLTLAETLKNITSHRDVFCASVGCYNERQSDNTFIEVTLISDVLFKHTYDHIMGNIPKENVEYCITQVIGDRMHICINLKFVDFFK